MSFDLRDFYRRSLVQVARDNFFMKQKYRITSGERARRDEALKQFAADLAQKRKEERKRA